jgi:hypothetical protein
MRAYYYRHARWSQGLMLAVLVMAGMATLFIEGRPDLSGAGLVRLSLGAVLVPGILSQRPVVHAVQAVLLVLVMAVTVAFVAAPIG